MKRFLIAASALGTILTANLARADCPAGLPAHTNCVSGRDSNGAYYLMAVPRFYNHSLVVWNHGYAQTPPAPLTAADLGPAGALLHEGFAAAASSFRPDLVGQSGWQVTDGAEDSENLRQLFISTFGRPALTFVVGASLGGLVTAEQIERFGVNPEDGSLNYNGAMPMCGPLAGGLENWYGAFDLRVVYQYYCRNLPRSGELDYPLYWGVDFRRPQPWTQEEILGRVNECTGILQPPGTQTPEQLENLGNILGVTKIPASFLPIDMIFATLAMEELVIVRLLGNNPVKNIGVFYTGSSDDDALNAGAFRADSTPLGETLLRGMYDPTGNVAMPTMTIHTIGDGLVIVENERSYLETRQAAGTDDNLFQTYVNAGGHCEFSNSEFAAAFHSLVGWVLTQNRPSQAEVGLLCELFKDFQFHDTCNFNADFQPDEITTRILPR